MTENDFEHMVKFAVVLQTFTDDEVRLLAAAAAAEPTDAGEEEDDRTLARLMLGVARIQNHINNVTRYVLDRMCPSEMRDVVKAVTEEGASVRVEATTLKSCGITGLETECVVLVLNGRRVVVARSLLVPIARCYAFSHVLEKLTQHEHARNDPRAYQTWKEDEQQLLLFAGAAHDAPVTPQLE